jgi:hypothetical protein
MIVRRTQRGRVPDWYFLLSVPEFRVIMFDL